MPSACATRARRGPRAFVGEIWRVLREGGLVHAETPFLQQVHAGGPHDFVRFTSSGRRHLFRRFEEIAARTDEVRARRKARERPTLPVALPRPLQPGFVRDGHAAAYFFLGRRAERELTPQEIVGYYQGAQGTRVRRIVRGRAIRG
jgi:hypothetical protein